MTTATAREILRDSDGNVQKSKELTPYTRGLIIGAALGGLSATCIARQYNLPRSTVAGTIQLHSLRDEGQSRPRSGRPKLCSDRDVRNLLRHVQLHPTDTYSQIRKALDAPYSTATLKRVLKENGITHQGISSVRKQAMKKKAAAEAVPPPN
jgi:transposase